jgi:hypothetical protein
MMTVEKEFTTPFGMALQTQSVSDWSVPRGYTYAAKTEVKRSNAFGSLKATRACFGTNFLFLIPVSLPATRLTAMSRSRSVKKKEFAGESESKKKITNAQRQVAPPSWRKSR